MRISAFSSNLRRRAAQDAPPATPPTMITFIFFSCVIVFFQLIGRPAQQLPRLEAIVESGRA
jgi:hypothetical protein